MLISPVRQRWVMTGLACLLCSVGPAQAALRTYVFEGSVSELSDPLGVLGTQAPGAAYTLTYLADFSVGQYGGAGGGFGSTNYLMGGSSFAADPFYPTLQTSPVSASLRIGGQTLVFAGDSYGLVQYTQNFFDLQFGGMGRSWADLSAQSTDMQTGAVLSQVTTALDSPGSAATFADILQQGALVVDGQAITAVQTFSLRWAAGTPEEATLSGTLAPSVLRVQDPAVVPEPAAWALLLLGLSLVPRQIRRRTTRIDLP